MYPIEISWVKILCVPYLHYIVAFTFVNIWYRNSSQKQNILFQNTLNWVQDWVTQLGLLTTWLAVSTKLLCSTIMRPGHKYPSMIQLLWETSVSNHPEECVTHCWAQWHVEMTMQTVSQSTIEGDPCKDKEQCHYYTFWHTLRICS